MRGLLSSGARRGYALLSITMTPRLAVGMLFDTGILAQEPLRVLLPAVAGMLGGQTPGHGDRDHSSWALRLKVVRDPLSKK